MASFDETGVRSSLEGLNRRCKRGDHIINIDLEGMFGACASCPYGFVSLHDGRAGRLSMRRSHIFLSDKQFDKHLYE